jgi:hypothetical protein
MIDYLTAAYRQLNLMSHKRRQDLLIPFLTVISDALAIEASFLFSYWLRFFSTLTNYIPISYGLPPLEAYITKFSCGYSCVVLAVSHAPFVFPRRITSFSDEFFAIVRTLCTRHAGCHGRCIFLPFIFLFTHCILDPSVFPQSCSSRSDDLLL